MDLGQAVGGAGGPSGPWVQPRHRCWSGRALRRENQRSGGQRRLSRTPLEVKAKVQPVSRRPDGCASPANLQADRSRPNSDRSGAAAPRRELIVQNPRPVTVAGPRSTTDSRSACEPVSLIAVVPRTSTLRRSSEQSSTARSSAPSARAPVAASRPVADR
ncbi:hypothetical protein [Nonomuraea dietziae]|uniref:hypothetical protein n=1 Tax=Nonomuraea dietziae TaxID=65515 RepID=UPI0031DC774F